MFNFLKQLMRAVAFLGLFASSTLHCQPIPDVRLGFPISFLASINEAKASRIDLGFGLSADYLFFTKGKLKMGPGFSMLTTVPASFNTRMISVKPFSILGEPRWVAALEFYDGHLGITPYLALGALMGACLVKKDISYSKALDVTALFGASVSTGVAFWFDRFGAGLSYGIRSTNQLMSHNVEITTRIALE